jgi:hypothetical protein
VHAVGSSRGMTGHLLQMSTDPVMCEVKYKTSFFKAALKIIQP